MCKIIRQPELVNTIVLLNSYLMSILKLTIKYRDLKMSANRQPKGDTRASRAMYVQRLPAARHCLCSRRQRWLQSFGAEAARRSVRLVLKPTRQREFQPQMKPEDKREAYGLYQSPHTRELEAKKLGLIWWPNQLHLPSNTHNIHTSQLPTRSTLSHSHNIRLQNTKYKRETQSL